MRAPRNFRKVATAVPELVRRGVTVRIATTVESLDKTTLERLCMLHRGWGVPGSPRSVDCC